MTVQTLDITADIPTSYCVDLWVRDEQVKLATARITGRICAPISPRERGDEPIAVVCYGPSLTDTWEQVKAFAFVMSCSGSHKFLVERGIIPRWHIEVDPRAHKVALIGPPQHGTEYLIASTCHQKVFDHLEGYDVKLWHVFASEAEAFRVLPPEEWALTGGSSVGLRAMAIARHLGFTNQHVFGMDGNRRDADEEMHAAAHPSQPKGYSLVEYKGRTWKTTPSLLACAKQTFHELNQMHDVLATFHGDGLVQAMAKDYVREPSTTEVLSIKKPELISAEYVALNARLHRENIAYGVGGGKHADIVKRLIATLPAPVSVLDYGCGKGYLQRALEFPIWQYDPAIEGLRESPRPADLVACTDVLEHIEPDKLRFVLNDLKRCVKKVGFFTIHTKAAVKTLADGRNAHLIQRDKVWWRAKLGAYFQIGKIIQKGPELYVVVGPKLKVKGKAA